MRVMLPEADDDEIRPAGAKKTNQAIHFVGFDQVAGYLNRVSASLGDGRLDEFLIMPPPIRFDTLRRIRSNSHGESAIRGRWFHNGDGLQGRVKKFA